MTASRPLFDPTADATHERRGARRSFGRIAPVNDRSTGPRNVIDGTCKRVLPFGRSLRTNRR